MCEVLKELYRKIYDEQFMYSQLDHRIKLQKAVYILENMGICVGDYSFSWNKYGPYSLGLDSDAQKYNSKEEKRVMFSEITEKGCAKIREYIKMESSYNCVNWIECIASLHYLKYIYRWSCIKFSENNIKS